MDPEPGMRMGEAFGESSRVALHAAAAGLLACLIAGGPYRISAQDDPAARQGGAARARFLMGARLSIETDGPVPAAVLESAFDEVARLEGIFSNWQRTSEVSRLNDEAARRPVGCSAELFAAVRTALRWAEETGGAFDPTVEPLVRALGLRGDGGRVIGGVGIDRLSLATSSNLERFVETPRGRIGHILDPAEARPARFQGSLTVAAHDATSADALSTALFVMGPDRGAAWAEARDIPALYLWRDDSGTLRCKSTRAFEDRFGGRVGRPGDPGWAEQLGEPADRREGAR